MILESVWLKSRSIKEKNGKEREDSIEFILYCVLYFVLKISML